MLSLKLKKEYPEIEEGLKKLGFNYVDGFYERWEGEGTILFGDTKWTLLVTNRLRSGMQCLIPLKYIRSFGQIQIMRPDGIRVCFIGDIRIRENGTAIYCYENETSKDLLCGFKIKDFDVLWRF